MTERVEIELNVDADTVRFLDGVAVMAQVSMDDVVSVMLAAYLKRMDQVPEGCTPTDAKVLREANQELARAWATARHDNAVKDEEIARAHAKIREIDNDLMARGSEVVRMSRELESKDEEIAAANGKIAKLEEDNAALRSTINNLATAKPPSAMSTSWSPSAEWQEDFANECNKFRVGQPVVTSWGEGTVQKIDPHWRDGGVWVNHLKGTPRFDPHNVKPVAGFHVEQIRAAAHAEFMDMREDNVSPMKFMRAVLKRLTGEDEK